MDKTNLNQIKQAFDKVEISTTSEAILQAYEKQTQNKLETKKPKKTWKITFISLGTTFALAASGVGIYFLTISNLNSNDFKPIVLQSKNEQAAFELSTGMNFINEAVAVESSRSADHLLKSKENSTLSETQFEELVNAYHQDFNTYQSFLNDGLNVTYEVETGNYISGLDPQKTYIYKMNINDQYYFFYNDALEEDNDDQDEDEEEKEYEFSGELKDGENIYQVDFEIELDAKSNEKEIEMSILYDKINNKSLKIEYGSEEKETSYSFSYLENNQKNKKVEIELEKSNNSISLNLEIETSNESSYKYKVKKIDNSVYEMKYEIEDFSLLGTIKYTVTTSGVSYVETSLNYSLIKKIQ